MARGRMLNKSISVSDKMAALPDNTCRLIATWIIPHLDKNGVFYAHPLIVKSQIMPLIEITAREVQLAIDSMRKAGLIQLFEADGKTWMVWPGFDENQKGYHLERERTEFPQPPATTGENPAPCQDKPDSAPGVSGNLPEVAGSFRKVLDEVEDEDEDEVEEKRSGASAPPTLNQVSATSTATFRATATPAAATFQKTVEIKAHLEPAVDPPRNLLFDAVAEVTASNPKLLGSRIAKLANELHKLNATPEQVHQVARWYASNDWRGKKGEKLTFEILKEVWDLGVRNTRLTPAIAGGYVKTGRRPQVPDSTEAEREAARVEARKNIAERAARKAAQGQAA